MSTWPDKFVIGLTGNIATGKSVVRRMLEHARGHHPDITAGRFVIEARHAAQPWEAIVEPDHERHLLVVVTAYPVEQGES